MVLLSVTLVIGFSIVWSTLRLGISPMPSSKKAGDAIIKLAGETGSGPIFDLGSGWGSLLIPLSKRYPQRQVVGYEMSVMPWLIAVSLKHLLRLKNLEVYRGDFLRTDLSAGSVLICYLSPSSMTAVSEKLNAEGESAKFIISNTFALPSRQPEKTIRLNDFYKSPVYLYRLE